MNIDEEIEEAQRLYKDILNGYSTFEYDKKTVFIKHLSDLDHGWIKEYKNKIYWEAKSQGVFSEEEKIESLIEQELWSKRKEHKVAENLDELSRLNETQEKMILKKQKEAFQKKIDKIQAESDLIEKERSELMGITCESFAQKKVNERYIYYTLYKSKDFKDTFFDEREFEEMDDDALTTLVILNNSELIKFALDNIRKVAAAAFFLNSLMVCKDNPFVFFGKPVILLSNYQIELFSTGLRYKGVIEQKGQTPPPMISLTEQKKWYEGMSTRSGERQKPSGESEGGGATVFGADKDELKQIVGGGKNVVDLHKGAGDIMEKTGKDHLDMMDMLKLHGEID